MERENLRKLELLNQLKLNETQKEEIISFFEQRDNDTALLNSIDTSKTERMVHVMPILTVVREDKVSQPFTREQLQQGAPDTDVGYWCVPRVLE